jgi:hypothetical protein
MSHIFFYKIDISGNLRSVGGDTEVITGSPCSGGDSCCDSKIGGCLTGEGDCDKDSHCAGDLVCGVDNCYGIGFDSTDDCCKSTVPVPGPDDIPITLSCNKMKTMHHDVIRAQLAYGCSSCSSTGEPTDCDREVLRDLLTCPKDDSLCIFNSIANRTSCAVSDDKPDTICNALHQLNSYILYTRQTFCETIGPRGSCGFFTILGCTAAVLAGGLACTASGPLFLPCMTGILGAGSSCIPCICDILGC